MRGVEGLTKVLLFCAAVFALPLSAQEAAKTIEMIPAPLPSWSVNPSERRSRARDLSVEKLKQKKIQKQIKIEINKELEILSQIKPGKDEVLLIIDQAPIDESTIDEALADPVFTLPSPRDPFETFNRVTFVFNDFIYRWILGPSGKVYGFVVPRVMRDGIKNMAYNLATPVRVVNSLLQGKVRRSGQEFLRFCLNTIMGGFGFVDSATELFGVKPVIQEDSAQTLAKYGMGNGFYIVLPILGPSSLRDSVGMVGDFLLDPLSYAGMGTSVFVKYNNMLMTLNEYERIRGQSYDPYSFIRDFYYWYRMNEVDR